MPPIRYQWWPPPGEHGSKGFLYVAIGAGVLYLCTQVFQQIVAIAWSPEENSGAPSLVQRLSTPDRLRRLSLLVSFLFLPILYMTVTRVLGERRPVAAILGFAFSMLFVLCEALHRVFDFFVVSLRWAPAFRIGDALQQQAILDRTNVWNEVVVGIYFVLLMAHLAGSLCFLWAAWAIPNRWNLAVSMMFALNGLRLVGRLAADYGGQAWLAPVNSLVYFPITLCLFGTLSLWLFFRQPQ
jgi:hypothetical protein